MRRLLLINRYLTLQIPLTSAPYIHATQCDDRPVVRSPVARVRARPRELGAPSSREMRRWQKVLLLASGAVPFLGLLGHPPDTALLIYSCFVLAVIFRCRLVAAAKALSVPATLQLF